MIVIVIVIVIVTVTVIATATIGRNVTVKNHVEDVVIFVILAGKRSRD